MGGFISDIQNNIIEIDTSLLNCSYSKLIQYYSSYKSICQGFTINVSEYILIFGPNQSFFAVWDTKNRGKIDAIQIFAGVIMFSRIKYQQKLKFLFEIFDFNEEGYLQYQNIALMIVNICNATYKIYQSNKTILTAKVQEFLDEYFTSDSRIQLQSLIRWTLKVPEIFRYMLNIGFPIQSTKQDKNIDYYTIEDYNQSRKFIKNTYKLDKDITFDHKFLTNIQAMMLAKSTEKQKLNFKIDWVYGINIKSNNIKYLRLQNKKAGNQTIIYTVGKVIIIYFPKLNVQKYYKNHKQEVAAIEISKYKKLIASAEDGEYPEIHIWDIRTRLNLIIFKRLHKSAISFMKFINNDRYLVTTSLNSTTKGKETPIIILNISTKEIIMSNYLSYQILGLGINHTNNYLLAVSPDNITKFTHINQDYQIESFNITSSSSLAITQNNNKIMCFVFYSDQQLITSSRGRQLYIWDQHFNSSPLHYTPSSKRQIKEMKMINSNVLILLDQLDIQIIHFTPDKYIKHTQLINVSQQNLFNLSLFHLQTINNDTILIFSTFGDIIKISNIFSQQIQYHKYYQIFKLQSIYDLQMYKDDIIILSSFFIYVSNKYEKQLRIMKKFNYQLHNSQMINNMLLICSHLQDKSMHLTLISLDTYYTIQHIRVHYDIDDIKMTQQYILILSDNTLYIYNKIKQLYFYSPPIIHKLHLDKLLYLVKNNTNKYYIITQNKQIYLLIINSLNQVQVNKVEKIVERIYGHLQMYYPEYNHKYPMIFNCQSFVAFANKNGTIQIWNSIQEMLKNYPASIIDVHSQNICKFMLDQKEFYSVGSLDGMVTSFKHQTYIQQDDQDSEKEASIPSLMKTTINGKRNEVSHLMSETKQISKINHKQEITKSSQLSNELKGNYLKQGYIEILGLNTLQDDQQLKKNQTIMQEKTTKVQRQTKLSFFLKNVQQTHQKSSHQFLNIEIQHIFGITCSNKYKNVFYVHNYSPTQRQQNQMKPQLWQNEQTNEAQNSILQFSKPALLYTQKMHNNCKRQVIYYSGRYCILRQRKNRERYYEHHRRKISCIAIHPNKQIICSCQISQNSPSINIWEAQNKVTLASIRTKHRMMIISAQFSKDGEWIVSLGGEDKFQSIQIVNWQNEQIIAFKQLQEQIFRDCIFNPYDKKEFCVAGIGVIRIYRIEEELFLKQEIKVPDHNIQVIAYTSNIYGTDIESDVIAGTTIGDIALYVCGSFIVSKKKAHEKGVTCLRLAELFKYKKVLISGGNDGFIKIWDTNFNQITKRDIRQQLFSVKNSVLQCPLCEITSLDIYQCTKKNNQDLTYMIISTSDGSIIEANIINENQGYQIISFPEKQVQTLKQKININLSILFASPPNLETTKFEIHNNLLVIYRSTNKFISIWNLTFAEREIVYSLDEEPIFIRFMNNKPIFLAGFMIHNNCALHFYELDWMGGIYVKTINLYGHLAVQKGSFYPKNAIFSSDNSKLALTIRVNGERDQVYYYKRKSQNGQKIQYTFVEVIQLKYQDILWTQFSSNNQALLITCKNVSSQLNYNDEIRYKCISLINFQQRRLHNYQFDNFNFSTKIKGYYIPFQTSSQNTHKDYYNSKDKIQFTSMIQYGKYVILGTFSGEIIITEVNAFDSKQKQSVCKGKILILCDKPVQKLQLKGDRLYVSCQKGENVMVFKLSIQKVLDKSQC